MNYFRYFAMILTISASAANAALVKTDFLNPNDGLIVKDSTTLFEWLTPVYTRGLIYNDPLVQSLIAIQGFRYATATEVTSMINLNFGNPTTVDPGDAVGFASAGQFFSLFGIAENIGCQGGPCPRTQGFTSTPGSIGEQLAFGMIQVGSTGYFITNNPWPIGSTDQQMGSFLIRPYVESTVPEASSVALIGLGLVLLAAQRKVGTSLSHP